MNRATIYDLIDYKLHDYMTVTPGFVQHTTCTIAHIYAEQVLFHYQEKYLSALLVFTFTVR